MKKIFACEFNMYSPEMLIFWKIDSFFNSCYIETFQHLGHIISMVFGCIPGGCVFLLFCDRSFFVKFTVLII